MLLSLSLSLSSLYGAGSFGRLHAITNERDGTRSLFNDRAALQDESDTTTLIAATASGSGGGIIIVKRKDTPRVSAKRGTRCALNGPFNLGNNGGLLRQEEFDKVVKR